MVIFLFCFFLFFWREEIAWSTVDIWVDVRHPDWCEHFCLYVFFSGHLFETIWYLRRSSHFQPSDRWRPQLDDAFAKVAANSVSHGVTSGQQGRKSPSPQICASPCVSAVMCNSCPATHSRKMTRDEPGISAGPPREPAGPPGTAIDFFW